MNITITKLDGTLNQVRKKLRSTNPLNPGIDPWKANITVLALQPGIGKSSWVRWFCQKPEMKDLAIGIASKRHNLLDEFERELGFAHWIGLSHSRSYCTQDIKNLVKLGLNASIICPVVCTKDERQHCEYHKQFKAEKACFPTEYLNTKYYHHFDILFVDEALYETNHYKYDEVAFEEGLAEFDDSEYLKQTIGAIETRDLDYFLKEVYPGATVLDILTKKQKKALRAAVEEEDTKRIKKILKFKADHLEKCLIHQVDEYSEPVMFRVFEFAETRPVVLTQATFNLKIFKQLIRRYVEEARIETGEYKVRVYTSEIKNKNTKVYRYTKRSFSKSQIDREVDFIQKVVESLTRKYGDDLGVITYKTYAQGMRMSGIDADHFFNTSGLNKFEGKKAILIIGTPSTKHEDKIKTGNRLLGTGLDALYLQPEIEYDVSMRRKMPGSKTTYKDTELEAIAEMDEAEMYDAIHRSRGLIQDAEIHVLGRVPDKIYEEFDVVEVSEPVSCDGDDDRIMRMIQDIKNGVTPTEFARKYGIRKKRRGYDVGKAKQIIEGLKEVIKI